jgi:hypothetical protein
MPKIGVISNMQEEHWHDSEWFKEWLKMAKDKPMEPNIGFWYYDNAERKWKFQKPS